MYVLSLILILLFIILLWRQARGVVAKEKTYLFFYCVGVSGDGVAHEQHMS